MERSKGSTCWAGRENLLSDNVKSLSQRGEPEVQAVGNAKWSILDKLPLTID
jgi:hypothetical protein